MNRRARGTVVLANTAAVAALFATVSVFAQTPIPWPPFPTTPSAPTTLRPNSVAHGPVAALTWRPGRILRDAAAAASGTVLSCLRLRCSSSRPDLQQSDRSMVIRQPAQRRSTAHRLRLRWVNRATACMRIASDLAAGTVPLDHSFLWRVGACRSQATTSCNYSAPTVLSQSTKNLKALNIAEYLSTAQGSLRMRK